MRKSILGVLLSAALCPLPASAVLAPNEVELGPFRFDSELFGNTLLESDGGLYSSQNWLNTIDADPGNPQYLTGADFNTGIANIAAPIYTIGYNHPIVNGPGADLGVVVARFSTDDVSLSVSLGDSGDFTSPQTIVSSTAVATGATRDYYYGNNNSTNTAFLFVHPIDLSSFGVPPGAAIDATRVTAAASDSAPQLDLIRVAGFYIPEPTTFTLLGLGSLALAVARRRG